MLPSKPLIPSVEEARWEELGRVAETVSNKDSTEAEDAPRRLRSISSGPELHWKGLVMLEKREAGPQEERATVADVQDDFKR